MPSEEELFREFLGLADGLAGQFCRRWIGLVDPEEMRQEARLELVRSIRALRCRESAGPYITRRIKGALAHWLRDRSRLVRVPRKPQEEGWVPVRHESLDQSVTPDADVCWLDLLPAPEDAEREQAEDLEQLEALLDQLPACEAAALRLSLLQGRSVTAAAAELGIRRQSLSRRVNRGLERLREAVAEG